MGDVVNLNQFRKSRNKQARKKEARQNVIAHGLTGVEKNRQKQQQIKNDALFNQKKIDKSPSDENDS